MSKRFRLNTLPALLKKKKRIGRGIGSSGAKSGRGMKGQKSRAGFRIRTGFEGGQTALYQRLPKQRGATKHSSSQTRKMTTVDFAEIHALSGQDIIGPGALRRAGIIHGSRARIKVVGTGSIDRPVTVRVHAISKAGRQAIEKSGGKVEIIE